MKTQLEEFTQAVIGALYLTDTGDIDQPTSDAELNEETRLDLVADCRSFWRHYGCYIMADTCECNRESGEYSKAAQAGHDFWLTRNGHGVGFLDGDWSEKYAEMLSDGAKSYGPFETFLGDDGRIYS